MAGLPFLIAGGGIGGLAAALALARQGRRSIVLERAAALGEIGAGIQIAPNAFHCFDELGVGDEARAVAVYIDMLRLMDGVSGDEICRVPLDYPFRAHFGNPYAVVHRADLHGVLLDGCRGSDLIELRTRHGVRGYSQDGAAVVAEIENGDAVRGTALIGADGINSAVRQRVVGDGAPVVSGHTTYRSVIPTEYMPENLRWNAATLWAGPKCHIVHYPLKGWKIFNLVVTYHNDVTEAVAGKPVSKDEVRRGFDDVHPKARQIIEHGDNWKLWVLCDRLPNERWVDGRVALLGDAAHPMLQYMAQGACMAMEDGVVLAQEIAAHDDLDGALAGYVARRFARTAKVQTGSRLTGEYVYHPAGGQARMRNDILGAKTPAQWNQDLSWLFGREAVTRNSG